MNASTTDHRLDFMAVPVTLPHILKPSVVITVHAQVIVCR